MGYGGRGGRESQTLNKGARSVSEKRRIRGGTNTPSTGAGRGELFREKSNLEAKKNLKTNHSPYEKRKRKKGEGHVTRAKK